MPQTTAQLIDRLRLLELIQGVPSVILLQPTENGCYTAIDEAHKGKTYSADELRQSKDVVIICDV